MRRLAYLTQYSSPVANLKDFLCLERTDCDHLAY